MPPSNTSRSESPLGGVLQPLVDLLRRGARRPNHLTGQEVVLPRTDVQAIIALDSGDDVHLLVTPAAGDDTRFDKLDLRGLHIANRDWTVTGKPPQRYLDISCSTGMSPSFLRPFLRFAEDVLFEIAIPEMDAVEALYKTGLRWRRFWSPDTTTSVTEEWVRGLAGELSFLRALVMRFGVRALTAWSGPHGQDHDFQRGTKVAVEGKTSAEMPYTIHANLRQLDPGIFTHLFLVCYRISRAENGVSLLALVSEVEAAIEGDTDALDLFYQALAAAGYRRDLEGAYAEYRLDIGEPAAFRVDDTFPRLTETSFAAPPDHRISEIRYTLRITGVDALSFDAVQSDLGELVS